MHVSRRIFFLFDREIGRSSYVSLLNSLSVVTAVTVAVAVILSGAATAAPGRHKLATQGGGIGGRGIAWS